MAKTDKDDELTTFELMVYRQVEYQKHTNDIFKSLKKVRRIIQEKLSDNPTLKDGVVEWIDVIMRPGDNENIYIELEIQFPIGTTIATPAGKHVTITEETESYFNKDVIVAVPLEVTEMSSYKEIKAAMNTQSEAHMSDNEPAPQRPPQPEDAMVDGVLSERDARAILLQARNPSGVKH